MSDVDSYSRQVAHKTYLKVAEKGTEAGAATALTPTPSLAPLGGVEMIVDRPFLVAIVDSDTGVVVFLGAITDPR